MNAGAGLGLSNTWSVRRYRYFFQQLNPPWHPLRQGVRQGVRRHLWGLPRLIELFLQRFLDLPVPSLMLEVGLTELFSAASSIQQDVVRLSYKYLHALTPAPQTPGTHVLAIIPG